MKLFGAMLAAGIGLWAGETRQPIKHVVTACLNPGANVSMFHRGQATATQILKQAGVRLNWRSEERTCTEGNGILITVSRDTPMNRHPGALAYALPFDHTNIVLFYDRVLTAASPAVTPFLVGHVLAHEIVHMLQGVDRHAASGIMKARWNSRDYSEMPRGRLTLTKEDVALIDRGRAARAE